MIVNALWVLFRAEGISKAIEIYKGMFAFNNIGLSDINTVVGYTANLNFPLIVDIAYVLGMTLLLLLVVFKYKNSSTMLENYLPAPKTFITAALLFAVAMLCLSRESVFIYFNF